MVNTYDNLIAAARRLQRVELLDAVRDQLLLAPAGEGIAELPNEECELFLKENHEPLSDARRVLTRRCHVPLEYSADYEKKRDEDSLQLSNLAWSFALGMAASERSGKLAEAVRFGVNILDLSNATRRGGIINDAFGSYGLASIGFDPLRRLRHQLNVENSSVLCTELLRIDVERETWNDIVMRDEGWQLRVPVANDSDTGLTESRDSVCIDEGDIDQETIDFLMKYVKIERIDVPSYQIPTLYRQQDDRELALIRLLAIEAALTAYRLKYGFSAADLRTLTPEFVDILPPDPFSEKPFRYRKAQYGFVVYSVGPHGNDCDGRLSGWSEVERGEADLFLDLDDYDTDDRIEREEEYSTGSLFGRLKSLIFWLPATPRKKKG